MKITNISIGTKDGTVLNSAADSLVSEGFGIEISCYDSYQLNEDPVVFAKMLDDVNDSDFITIHVHGDTSYLKRFQRLKECLDSGRDAILVCTDDCVTVSFRYLFRGNDGDYFKLQTFLTLGGMENHKSFLKWALNRFEGADTEVPEPVRPPAQGIYYPGKPIDFTEYISSMDRTKPCIGVFFYQKQWLTGNTKAIDALIKEIERHDATPVAVFLKTYEEEISGSIGVGRILKEYLTDEKGPILQAIIETMSFSQTLISKPGCGEQAGDSNCLSEYGVPVIQAMTTNAVAADWMNDINGLSPSEIAYDIVHPEFDGQIISVPCASTEIDGSGARVNMPLADRTKRVADTAVMWARLGMKNNADKKVAVLLYMYPPKNANAGGASGLDTFRSVVSLLNRLKDIGYTVSDIPDSPKLLADRLLENLTNDFSMLSDESVRNRAADTVGKDVYDKWYSELSEKARSALEDGWGKPMGDVAVVDGKAAIPGVLFGNVFVGFQPDRGRDSQRDYHNPNIVMPHQYLAFYRWLRYVFGADALIHVGTHGTLEWLPGKSVALSSDCCPDFVMDSVPDIYPYIIGNPGEGIQAKRRASAVIVDHMIPAMVRSGGYDDLEGLESVLQTYMNASAQGQTGKLPAIVSEIRGYADRMEIYGDIGLSKDCSDSELENAVDGLYDYAVDLKHNLIKDGLHTLGEVPCGKRLEEMVYSLTRVPNGEIPSLRDSVASTLGYDAHALLSDPCGYTGGTLNGTLSEDIEVRTEFLIHSMSECDFNCSLCREYSDGNADLEKVICFICETLIPAIRSMGRELDSVSEALSGRFVEPGPSGCPTRGRAQLLPTGRNFYSLDPDSIPWHSSWNIGVSLADQMLERYIGDYGTYPHEIGIVLWATDTMKTGGDDVAYILWLLGVRPVWANSDRVIGFEIIPLEELGRPRIDVAVRISGLFRDTFPNLANYIDDAVKAVMSLDESEEDNYILANLRKDVVESIAAGIPEDAAREEASVRIFGDAPGTYGSGTNILIRTSDWKDISDIGSIYRSYGEYAYGRGMKGKRVPEAFRRNLGRMDVTVKNSVSREYDMIDNDDVYNDLGGMNAAVRSISGKMPMSVIGCSADTAMLRTRTIDEECRYIFRSKILNPKWIEGLKEHGFRGAQEISDMAEYVFAWDATSGIIDGWQYRSIAEKFLFDGTNSEWLRSVNPYAMFETVQWLLEAIGRGMWDADKDTEDRLKRLYESLESDMEGTE